MADKKKGDTKATESLEHTAGGLTTRDDVLDLGVPMIQGDAREPVGPEDALGPGPKRGDYSERLGDTNYKPHQTVYVPPEEREEGEPHTRVVNQAPLASVQGEEARKKGGVTTTE